MERRQAIIVRHHDSKEFEFLGGPLTPDDAYNAFMTFRTAGGKHPLYADAILCDLPIDRHERFACPPAPAPDSGSTVRVEAAKKGRRSES